MADDTFDSRHRDLLSRRDLQFSFEAPEAPPPPPDWVISILDALELLAPLFNVLLWAALAIGVGFLVWFIGRELLAGRMSGRAKADDAGPVQVPEYRPTEARSRVLLEEADRLAEQGLFDEAARSLLHRSIEDIEARLPNVVRRGNTAREIAALARVPAAARAAFAPIARAVELSWFGGRRLDADGWRMCRKSYTDFAFPETWT